MNMDMSQELSVITLIFILLVFRIAQDAEQLSIMKWLSWSLQLHGLEYSLTETYLYLRELKQAPEGVKNVALFIAFFEQIQTRFLWMTHRLIVV